MKKRRIFGTELVTKIVLISTLVPVSMISYTNKEVKISRIPNNKIAESISKAYQLSSMAYWSNPIPGWS